MSGNTAFGVAFALVAVLNCVVVGNGGPAVTVMPSVIAAIVAARAAGHCFGMRSRRRTYD